MVLDNALRDAMNNARTRLLNALDKACAFGPHVHRVSPSHPAASWQIGSTWCGKATLSVLPIGQLDLCRMPQFVDKVPLILGGWGWGTIWLRGSSAGHGPWVSAWPPSPITNTIPRPRSSKPEHLCWELWCVRNGDWCRTTRTYREYRSGLSSGEGMIFPLSGWDLHNFSQLWDAAVFATGALVGGNG